MMMKPRLYGFNVITPPGMYISVSGGINAAQRCEIGQSHLDDGPAFSLIFQLLLCKPLLLDFYIAGMLTFANLQ